MSFSAVGQVFDITAFRDHVATMDLSWAKGITFHHTAFPNLAMRPKGFTIQHMRNIQHGYAIERGWDRGPHLFVDEDQIFGLTPLDTQGIHAVAFNRTHIGIEALGNYDQDDPSTGRGIHVWQTTAAAAAILLERMGKTVDDPEAITFHRDDPSTTKTCPGKKVTHSFIKDLISGFTSQSPSGPLPVPSQPSPMDTAAFLERIAAIEWQTKKLRELIT